MNRVFGCVLSARPGKSPKADSRPAPLFHGHQLCDFTSMSLVKAVRCRFWWIGAYLETDFLVFCREAVAPARLVA